MTNKARVSLVLSILLAAAVGASSAQAGVGDLDRSFGTKGKVLRSLGPEDEAVDVATQPDGKVVVLSQVEADGDQRLVVARLLASGRIDEGFGNRGVHVIRLNGREFAGGLALQSNGRILVSFTSDPSEANSLFGVARLRGDGELDRTFDNDGIQTAGFGAGAGGPIATDVVAAGSRPVVVGYVDSPGPGASDFAVARFKANGEIDETFAGDGTQTTDLDGFSDSAMAAALDSEGRLVVAGKGTLGPCCTERLMITRYDTSGELDGTFGDAGIRVSDVAIGAADVAVAAGDRIAIASTASNDYLVARFTEGGDPDGSFSGDGKQTIDFVDGFDSATSIARDGSKLVVSGFIRTPRRGRDFGVARLRSNGVLDTPFGNQGRRAIDFRRGEDLANSVAIDRKHRVVVAGAVRGIPTGTGLARLVGRAG